MISHATTTFPIQNALFPHCVDHSRSQRSFPALRPHFPPKTSFSHNANAYRYSILSRLNCTSPTHTSARPTTADIVDDLLDNHLPPSPCWTVSSWVRGAQATPHDTTRKAGWLLRGLTEGDVRQPETLLFLTTRQLKQAQRRWAFAFPLTERGANVLVCPCVRRRDHAVAAEAAAAEAWATREAGVGGGPRASARGEGEKHSRRWTRGKVRAGSQIRLEDSLRLPIAKARERRGTSRTLTKHSAERANSKWRGGTADMKLRRELQCFRSMRFALCFLLKLVTCLLPALYRLCSQALDLPATPA
jgi:hypothetical protein